MILEFPGFRLIIVMQCQPIYKTVTEQTNLRKYSPPKAPNLGTVLSHFHSELGVLRLGLYYTRENDNKCKIITETGIRGNIFI